MNRFFLQLALFTFLFSFSFSFNAQEGEPDLLSLVEQPKSTKPEKVYATFKTSKIVAAQTIETVKKNTLDFRITHRFGDVGVKDAEQSFWGMDNANDIRYSFDYGITDNITVGFGRSKYNSMIDGSIKWRFLQQNKNFIIPISMAIYSCMGATYMKKQNLYKGLEVEKEKFIHRFNYHTELIIASKITDWFSIEVLPGYLHRNFVKADINAANGAEETNGLFTLGAGMRLRFTKRIALVADYYHAFSKFREKNPSFAFVDPFAVGLEIETGGHVFHINFTNATSILTNNFIPNTTDSWESGKYKFGFNISRVFSF